MTAGLAADGGGVAGEQAAAASHADGGGTGQPDRLTNRECLDQADGQWPAWVISAQVGPLRVLMPISSCAVMCTVSHHDMTGIS